MGEKGKRQSLFMKSSESNGELAAQLASVFGKAEKDRIKAQVEGIGLGKGEGSPPYQKLGERGKG